jgi:hypothetical protein
MSDGHRMCSSSRIHQEEVWWRAYGASSSELSSSPVHWHDPEDASPLDCIAPSSPDLAASSSSVSPEHVASSLEELSCPTAEDVLGRE